MRPSAPTLALAFALAMALAGCADDGGGGDGGGAGQGTLSASASTTGPPPKPVPTSEELHLLAAPDMAPAIPDGYGEASTPTTTGNFGPGGGGQDGPTSAWAYEVQQATNVTGGEARIWIQVTDTLVQFPDPRPEGGCTWFLSLELGADSEVDVGCLTEPPGPINPGIKELVFPILSMDGFEMERNETISVRFSRAAFSASPDNSVFVLSGSAEHDSRLVLKGLKEPLPA